MNTSGQQLCIGAHTLGDDVVLDQEERRRHLYIVGQTGTGKSTLLLNLIRQDLAAGEGSVVVPIAQMGFIVTAGLGIVVLREPVTTCKIIGLGAAVAALVAFTL